MWGRSGRSRLRHRGTTAGKFTNAKVVWPARPGRRWAFVAPVLWFIYALLQFLAVTALPAYGRTAFAPVSDAICYFLGRRDCDIASSVALFGLANIAGGLIIIQEVWRRRDTQAALREIAADYAGSQKLLRVGMWSWNAVTDHFQFNSASRHILSLKPAADTSLRAFAAIFLVEGNDLAEVIRETARFSRSFSKECRLADPNHLIEWVEITGHCSNGQQCSGYIIDITQRKRLERDLNKIREQMSVYAEASSVLTHELKQPLAAILGNAEAVRRMLKNDNANLAEVREAIGDIIQEDGRAADIIAHMKSFFRRDDTFCTKVELESVVREAAKIMHVEFVKRNVESAIHVHGNIPYAIGDPVQIQQVLLNLIGNAVDAMDSKSDGAKKILIDLSFDDATDFVTISISDTGPGISENARRHLFSPYFTTKSNGTGLGLYICRSVVAAHGGRISAANNSNGGATFTIYLPKGLSDAVWEKARAIRSS